ncbi:MAG TPA: cation transporter [Longimicrobium sp.]|nr:cation transporter [Longimicrobium sp.]
MKTTHLTIGGMSCAHCVSAVQTALRNTPGVKAASVEIGSADVDYDESAVSPQQLADAVTEEGYTVTIA